MRDAECMCSTYIPVGLGQQTLLCGVSVSVFVLEERRDEG